LRFPVKLTLDHRDNRAWGEMGECSPDQVDLLNRKIGVRSSAAICRVPTSTAKRFSITDLKLSQQPVFVVIIILNSAAMSMYQKFYRVS
jgi:hypothetical protein